MTQYLPETVAPGPLPALSRNSTDHSSKLEQSIFLLHQRPAALLINQVTKYELQRAVMAPKTAWNKTLYLAKVGILAIVGNFQIPLQPPPDFHTTFGNKEVIALQSHSHPFKNTDTGYNCIRVN